MQLKLPKALQREPLVDAVFEVRFEGAESLADILPGFLFHDLDPKPTIARLQTAAIPQPMRASNPTLQYAPTQRLEWGQYFISVGDQTIVISCKLPYPKWPSFKAAILDIVGRVVKADIAGRVERYSVKYVNLIQAPTLAEQISKIKMEIQLGNIEVNDDQMSLQVHRKEDDLIHILSIVIGAQGTLSGGEQVYGAVVDVDSIRKVNALDFKDFASNLEEGVESLRQANKAKFFGCLTEETIEEMGPKYE